MVGGGRKKSLWIALVVVGLAGFLGGLVSMFTPWLGSTIARTPLTGPTVTFGSLVIYLVGAAPLVFGGGYEVRHRR